MPELAAINQIGVGGASMTIERMRASALPGCHAAVACMLDVAGTGVGAALAGPAAEALAGKGTAELV